jgi:hypothetical protein
MSQVECTVQDNIMGSGLLNQNGFIVMSSFFSGWSAHEIVGPLKKQEMRVSLLDYGIEKAKFRTWDTIERMVLESSDEIKMVLYQNGEAKRKVEEDHRACVGKRHRETQTMRINVRRRLSDFFFFGFD